VVTLDRGDDLHRAAGADVVFLAAPIPENIRLLSALPSHVPDEALVTDTGSTKRTTLAAARALPPRLKFIGGHPMAGAAGGGLGIATQDLFDRRPWILTPSPDTRPEDLRALRTLIESLGAVVHVMDAAAHDRVLAFVSHLPQLAVSALMDTVGSAVGKDGLAMAGAGLRDSTRLAASPAPMWRDIVESNADNVEGALDRLIAALEQLRGDRDAALPRIFNEAAQWRRVLDKGEHR
jgi:prephenate dehydrogenase